jgi:hypothetical protein
MFKRAWADYEDNEELPPLPWNFVVTPKSPITNKFWLLNMEENSEDSDEDFCLGCETGTDAACTHTCCN